MLILERDYRYSRAPEYSVVFLFVFFEAGKAEIF